MGIPELAAALLLLAGGGFFLAGTVGLLRFPDLYTRLHAVTKGDNLGLGLLSFGLMLLARDWSTVLELMAVWLLVLLGSATQANLLARAAADRGVAPWKRP